MRRTRARDATRFAHGLACVLVGVVAACSSQPDIVAHTVSDVAVQDGGTPPTSAGDDAAMPTEGPGDADLVDAAGSPIDSGTSSAPILLVGASDAGTCTLSDALRNAGLGVELWVVALTCRVPLWWFTKGISGIDQRELQRILLGETDVLPSGEGHSPDACDLNHAVFYYDDPINPANVILCNSTCTALRARLIAGSDQISCTPPSSASRDGG